LVTFLTTFVLLIAFSKSEHFIVHQFIFYPLSVVALVLIFSMIFNAIGGCFRYNYEDDEIVVKNLIVSVQ